MSLKDQIPGMIKQWNNNQVSLKYKSDLFDIHEGDLFRYIDDKLRETLGVDSNAYKYARSRIAPINLLQKIIAKLSSIYNDGPKREIYDSSSEDADQELLEWYEDKFEMNSKMDIVNENYNLTKIGLVMPVLKDGEPSLRVYPSHHFMVFNDGSGNPQEMTTLMTYQGKTSDNKDLFYAYTDDEFIAFTSDNNIAHDILRDLDNPNGVNIYGKIPAVYVNKSRTLLMPLDDTDLKQMIIIIPLLLSDLNLVSMFTAFSIIYAIDVDDAEMKYTPSAFWSLKSDPTSDKKPEIGTIKPEADIEETIKLISTELAMWLNSRGLKVGTIGSVTAENSASGVAKMVDEADATENKKKQAGIFSRSEQKDFWGLMINHIHPVWVNQGLESNQLFSSNAKVRVTFPAQEVLRPRSEQVLDALAEKDAGFISVKRAIKNLNPSMSDLEIEDLIAEIDAEATIEVPNVSKMAAN